MGILENPFHMKTIEESLAELESSIDGLDKGEVSIRLEKYGYNELEEGKRKTIIDMFVDQFKNIMIIILIVAAVISGALGEITDMVVILAIVIINAVLGVVQESKADKALEDLKKMSVPFVKVKRNSLVLQIRTEELVPGDIVILEAGDFVLADMRLVESSSLKIEESALTGESVPVEKSTGPIYDAEIVIGDRFNMAYSGSIVTYGRGLGVVVSTGMDTEVGKIARHISEEKVKATPLQIKIEEMSKVLTVIILVIAAVIFAVGVVQGRESFEMFLTAVSLAVAAIPEGLPAVITIVLAIGVQKMAKQNAIVRKLSAVETLGCTEIICSDKTGTLTQNKMAVKRIFINGDTYEHDKVDNSISGIDIFVETIILCNDSKTNTSKGEIVDIIGDPTETALVRFGSDKGFNKDDYEKRFVRLGELPFDSERKLMSTVNDVNGKFRVMAKGAPDILIERCDRVLINGEIIPMDDELRLSISDANSKMARSALRVLALSFKEIDSIPEKLSPDDIEYGLVFCGLVGMMDPPRPEVKEAVRICREAGIRPVMITGDHKDTAAAIAKEIDIAAGDGEVITGAELDRISDHDFEKLVSNYSVYARVSPEHKMRIIRAWQKNGKVVAMTGDGVNDAPALKAADIGIGMGITGTDVSKSVSNMVLSDDNFATIVLSVEEGRKIYSNITKSIQYLLACNFGEVLTLFIGTMMGWSILLPIQILWINLVTDAFPALALGFEKAEGDVMTQRPRKSNESFFAGRVGADIFLQGGSEGLITLAVYYLAAMSYSDKVATTMAFATLGLMQLVHSMNVRSNKASIFKMGFLSNPYLNLAIIVSGIMQVSVIAIPFLNDIFKVESLNLEQWVMVAAASFFIIPIAEIIKVVQNRMKV